MSEERRQATTNWAEVLGEIRCSSLVPNSNIERKSRGTTDIDATSISFFRNESHDDNNVDILGMEKCIEHKVAKRYLRVFRLYQLQFVHQMKQYIDTIQYLKLQKLHESYHSQTILPTITTDIKNLILNTRNALRFGLNCFSISNNDDNDNNLEAFVRMIIQNEACENEWHTVVVKVLSLPSGDSKCRLYAAQILCNLVTSNIKTCMLIITKTIQHFIPRNDVLIRRMYQNIHSNDYDVRKLTENEQQNGNTHCSSNDTSAINWLDLILNCTRLHQRDAMGAIIACLHNLICLLEDTNRSSSHNCHHDILDSFVENLASCSLLMSTCLRQVMDSKLIQQQLVGSQSNIVTEENRVNDEGTEWILLLLNKLCCMGYLPIIYQCIGTTDSSMESNAKMHGRKNVLPEQLILLHCLQHQLTSNHSSSLFIDTQIQRREINNNDESGSDIMIHPKMVCLYLFLCNLYIQLLPTDSTSRDSDKCGMSLDDDNYDHALRDQACDILLEIIATTMAANDSSSVNVLRSCIGRETNLISVLLRQLCHTVDRIEYKQQQIEQMYVGYNSNKQYSKSRESNISLCDQRFCTVAIRILGSLCYQNMYNQDLIRLTSMNEPFPTTSSKSPLEKNRDDKDEQVEKFVQLQNQESDHTHQTRNGIHVMLSTTSLSHSCFTLREWSIIAIRYLLDNNVANQRVVDELEVKQAVQSNALQDMGLQVDMNKNTGKVSIKTIDATNIDKS